MNLYEGLRCHGVPLVTISRGRLVYENGIFTCAEGSGKFCPLRTFPDYLYKKMVQREKVSDRRGSIKPELECTSSIDIEKLNISQRNTAFDCLIFLVSFSSFLVCVHLSLLFCFPCFISFFPLYLPPFLVSFPHSPPLFISSLLLLPSHCLYFLLCFLPCSFSFLLSSPCLDCLRFKCTDCVFSRKVRRCPIHLLVV